MGVAYECTKCGAEVWLGSVTDIHYEPCYACLQAENKRLEATVDKLPKCWRRDEDGKRVQDVPVLPGMVIWSPGCGEVERLEVISLDDLSSRWPATVRMATSCGGTSVYRWHVQACYSTREAAEAGKDGDAQ